MEKYEYKVVSIKFNTWTSKAEADYLEVLNEMGMEGWRFIQFSPQFVTPEKGKKFDMLFERKITDQDLR